MLSILRTRLRWWVGASVVLLVCSVPLARAAGNLWLMLNDGGAYVVPDRSSIFTFVPTVMNDGSGGWWIYGEDLSTYYWYAERSPGESVFVSKRDARRCPNFDPVNASTWCGGHVSAVGAGHSSPR